MYLHVDPVFDMVYMYLHVFICRYYHLHGIPISACRHYIVTLSVYKLHIISLIISVMLIAVTDTTSAVIRWGSVYEFILPYSGHVKGFSRQNHFEVLVAGFKFEIHKSNPNALSVTFMDGDMEQLDGLLGKSS